MEQNVVAVRSEVWFGCESRGYVETELNIDDTEQPPNYRD